jgi:predicted GTPase
MNDTNNNGNGRVPIKIVQLLIDNVKLEFTNSQEKISKEISELTKAMVTVVNKINGTDKILIDKLDVVKSKVSKMILVVTVAFSMLMGAVALSIFGSHLLYEHNKAIEEQASSMPKPNKIKDELKNDTMDEINEEKQAEK